MSIQLVVQTATLLLAHAASVYLIRLYKVTHLKVPVVLALTGTVHTILFYVYVIVNVLAHGYCDATTWSYLLRWHTTFITFLSTIVILGDRLRRER